MNERRFTVLIIDASRTINSLRRHPADLRGDCTPQGRTDNDFSKELSHCNTVRHYSSVLNHRDYNYSPNNFNAC